MRFILIMLFTCFFIHASAQKNVFPQPKSQLKIGFYFTRFHPDKVYTIDTFVYTDVPHYTKNAHAIGFGALFQLKNNSYLETNIRFKFIKFYVRTDHLIYPQGYPVGTFEYSTYTTPAFDINLSYGHRFTYKRFYALAKAGPTIYLQPQIRDTNVFDDHFGYELSFGYNGNNAIRIGYNLGAEINYRLSKGLDIGLEAIYNGTFNNRYDYFLKIRKKNNFGGYLPDNTWGMRLHNLYMGLNLKIALKS